VHLSRETIKFIIEAPGIISMPNQPPFVIGFLSEPGMFDPIETWEEFLAEMQAMPDSAWKDGLIEKAKWVIARNRQMLRARAHGVKWLH
jgi:hypothetical protein